MTPTPIQFARSYQTSDGKCYATLEEAQRVEIENLLSTHVQRDNVSISGVTSKIVEHKDAILAILTLTDKSRPRARGKSKPRNGKARSNEELPSASDVRGILK